MDTRQNFFDILFALHNSKVRFVILNGLAMRLHGSAHITEDISLSYSRSPKNLARLIEALSQFHPKLYDKQALSTSPHVNLDTDIGEIDLFAEPAGIDSFEGLWERSEIMEVDGHSVHVCSIDDLIAMKKAANRPKDQTHLMELQALAKIIKEEKTESSPEM